MKVTIGLVLAMTAAVLMAGERRGSGEIAEYLQLTPAQQTTWQSARSDFEASVEPLARKAREIGERMESSLKNHTGDACSLGNDLLAKQAVHDQIRAAKQTLEQKQQSVLTPEQKTKLDAFRAARGEDGMIKRRSEF